MWVSPIAQLADADRRRSGHLAVRGRAQLRHPGAAVDRSVLPYLELLVDGERWVAASPGADEPAAEIIYIAQADGTAIVTVSNQGDPLGGTRYTLSVSATDAAMTQTPEPPATSATPTASGRPTSTPRRLHRGRAHAYHSSLTPQPTTAHGAPGHTHRTSPLSHAHECPRARHQQRAPPRPRQDYTHSHADVTPAT